MPTPFLSSEEYDERAHQLYNEGQYDEALEVLREGLSLYPNSVELHIGVGYARLAREEFPWARRSFEEALVLEPEHEDALAGLAETLLRFGQRDAAVRTFRRILELGYSDDLDLVLQAGRALFREDSPKMPLMEAAKEFFDVAVKQAPEMAEAVACLGYTQHRLGDDATAIGTLRRALQLDNEHIEARIYLANIFYDRQDFEAALYHLERTTPDDHWDELGIWRVIELKKSLHGAADGDADLKPWEDRLEELAGELDDIEEMLAEVESRMAESELEDGEAARRGQRELFGLLTDLVEKRRDHTVRTTEGREFVGSWDEIVRGMRDASGTHADRPIEEYMATEARRLRSLTGVEIRSDDAESFIRASASAGLLRILK